MTAQTWVALLLGLATLGLALAGWKQKLDADRADQWWKRVQWAIDKALDDSPATSDVGSRAFMALADRPHVAPHDRDLLAQIGDSMLADDPGQSDETDDNGPHTVGGENA